MYKPIVGRSCKRDYKLKSLLHLWLGLGLGLTLGLGLYVKRMGGRAVSYVFTPIPVYWKIMYTYSGVR